MQHSRYKSYGHDTLDQAIFPATPYRWDILFKNTQHKLLTVNNTTGVPQLITVSENKFLILSINDTPHVSIVRTDDFHYALATEDMSGRCVWWGRCGWTSQPVSAVEFVKKTGMISRFALRDFRFTEAEILNNREPPVRGLSIIQIRPSL